MLLYGECFLVIHDDCVCVCTPMFVFLNEMDDTCARRTREIHAGLGPCHRVYTRKSRRVHKAVHVHTSDTRHGWRSALGVHVMPYVLRVYMKAHTRRGSKHRV